jgi:hypothetical protein
MSNLSITPLDSEHQVPTGHCRAQRQALYSRGDMHAAFPTRKTSTPMVLSFVGSDDEWTNCREELERWGMEVTETQANKPREGTEGGAGEVMRRVWGG